MSFSHGSEGGTLALPSPTHAHHMDVSSAVRSLRRSMSRSPSTKFLSRSNSNSSDSTNSQQPSPQSPCRRFGLTPHRRASPSSHAQTAPPSTLFASSTNAPQTPNFPSIRPSGRLSLRSAKSAKTATPSRPLSRLRASPKSPLRRALNSNNDCGNSSLSTVFSAPQPSLGQENVATVARSPPRRRNLEKPSRHSLHLDVSGASQHAFLKALDANKSPSMTATGALKRSDATMNLDQPNQGSPVAKRRSLHGFSSLAQPDEMTAASPRAMPSRRSFEIHEDLNSEYELTAAVDVPRTDLFTSSGSGSTVPQRSSSLRKTTLQQRSLTRRSGERQLAQMTADPASPARSRPRLSSEHFLPPQATRESIFSSKIPLPSASAHVVEASRPHPLSKTLTTSSSGGSLEEEQPSFYAPAPVKAFEASKPHPFSKSLPVGAMRPNARALHDHNKVVSTPNGSNQLWLGAFNSTGLISKVNRNFEEEAEKKIVPPDTPCKKHSNPFATYPPKFASVLKKKENNRKSFGGIPSTPFGAAASQAPDTFGKPGKGLAIFQRGTALRNSRRGSILGLDEEDRKFLGDSQDAATMGESDVPPTPTRNTLTPSGSNLSQQSLESPSANRTQAAPMSAVRPPISRESTGKSTHRAFELPADIVDEKPNGNAVPDSDGLGQTPVSTMLPPSSFGRSRFKQDSRVPVPLLSVTTSSNAPNGSNAKIQSANPASPVDGRRTPQTPQEGYLPWDTSRLSISQTASGVAPDAMPPPMTPTGGRDLRSSTSIFVTPANVRTQNLDVDSSLTGRFDKVEYIGKGEFSSVFRVSVANHRQNALDALSGTPQLDASHSPARGSIFAVKKSRHPFQGPKDREAKLREVRVLQSLTHAEHVVQYVDSWEHNYHLYIQTEFCEEGTLDKFLGNVGRGGRLDDFRIFKMLQDLCLGLKEIHDAGFMHLDMKPANILITFEGALKIGDFGLAQPTTALEGVDVEGDREYMAPEMLKGNVSGSADIFSLGLITLEAAANVVLPDNGPTWIALRSGDLSEVPSLTWTPSVESRRDATGNPTESGLSDELGAVQTHDGGNLFGSLKRSELQQPPDFMVNPAHPSSLDSVVRWMTAQDPSQRPLADQVLELEGLRWVAEHRSAPATVYEGSWGPAETVPISIMVDSDSEMIDV